MRAFGMTIVAAAAVALNGCEITTADPAATNEAAGENAAGANLADANTAATTAEANLAGAEAGASRAPLVRTASDGALEWGGCPEGFPQGCQIAVLHGDPSQANSDILLRVPGGASIPPHSHGSAERMILVSGQLEVKYQGAPPALLRPGTYAYGPAGLPHRADCRSSEPCVLFIAFVDAVDAVPFEGSLD